MKVIGLMSGTSLDGIDAALLDLDEVDGAVRWQVLGARTTPYDDERRARIAHAIRGAGASEICRLHADLGEWFAEAALALLDEIGVTASEVAVLGSHGQTLWHEPPTAEQRGATLQIGCGATIAERTGIPVVSDFRSRDVAAGGHGAPLVPYADSVLFRAPEVQAFFKRESMSDDAPNPPAIEVVDAVDGDRHLSIAYRARLCCSRKLAVCVECAEMEKL